MKHNCTTTLAPSAPWPAYGTTTQETRIRRLVLNQPLTCAKEIQEAAVIAFIKEHGPCNLHKLTQCTGVGRKMTERILGRLATRYSPNFGIAKTMLVNNSITSHLYGFLP